MKEIPADQADRIEKKLDLIIEHFNIGARLPRSPIELMELARKKEAGRKIRLARRAEVKAVSLDRANRRDGANAGSG